MKLTKHKGPHAYEFALINFYSWVKYLHNHPFSSDF